MMHELEFLPEPLSYDGDWPRFVEELYKIFQRDFMLSQPRLENMLVCIDNRKIDDSREEGFWHLVTRQDKQASERFPEIPRAERLPWIRPLIENYQNKNVTYWRYLEGNRKVRHYIWAKAVDFAVILAQEKVRLFVVTAFCVDFEGKKSDLERRYAKRLV